MKFRLAAFSIFLAVICGFSGSAAAQPRPSPNTVLLLRSMCTDPMTGAIPAPGHPMFQLCGCFARVIAAREEFCYPAVSQLATDDERLFLSIVDSCGGSHYCVGANWGMAQYGRCRAGNWNACVFPTIPSIDRLPQHLQPRAIIPNMVNDVRHGPGARNDLLGEDGWLCENLFGGCD